MKTASYSDFRRNLSNEETEYLLKSPRNADRLLASIAELDNGGGMEQVISE